MATKIKNQANLPVEQIPVQTETKDKKQGIFAKLLNRKKLKTPDTIAVLFLRINGTAEVIYKEPKLGIFEQSGRTYHVLEDCRYTMSLGKETLPLCILPEKSLTPLGTGKYYDQDLQERVAELQDLCIRGIKSAELVKLEGEKKPGMNPKTVIIFVILAIIGFAFYKQYGG